MFQHPQGSQTIQGTEVKLNNLSNKEPWELTSYWPRNHNIPSVPTIYPPPQLSFFGPGGCISLPLWASFCSDLTSSFLSFPRSRASIFIVHQQGGNGTLFASCPCDNVKKRKDSPVSGSGDKKRGKEKEKERENLERMPAGTRAPMFS